MRKQQSGNILFNVLLVMLIVTIGVLAYMLINKRDETTGRTMTVVSPNAPTATVATDDDEFNDGLRNPDTVTRGTLDEFGAGIAETAVFNRDINDDGRPDRITRRRVENGTDHFYYDYKIELNTKNGYTDITPNGFRTTEGADCALQKLRFVFKPDFRVIKISRDWEQSWDTPTPATRTEYTITGNQFHNIASTPVGTICNVADLF